MKKAKAKKTKMKPGKMSVALELHNDFVKIAGAFFTKGAKIFRMVKKDFSSKASDTRAQEVSAILKKYKFPKENLLLSIPRHLVMTRILHLPSVSDDEIICMAKMEAIKQMPYRDENIITGHRVIEKFKDGYSDVLLAIVQESTIKRFINTLKGGNLRIEKVALSTESLFAWYMMLEKRRENKTEVAAVVNISSGYIDIAILENEKLVFTRAFSYGADDAYTSTDSIDEIKKSIATFEKEKNKKVQKIITSGGENKGRTAEEVLRKEFDIPVKFIPQDEGIKVDSSSDADLKEVSYVELIGLSAKSKSIKINLLPEDMIQDNEFRIFKKSILKTTILLGCIVLIVLGIFIKKIFDKSKYIALLDAKITAMEPEVIRTRRMREDIRIIKNVIQKKPLAIDIVGEIYKIAPTDITFNMVDYESKKSLILRGSASSLSSIVGFISILEKSDYFESVKIRYTAKRKTSGKELTDFEIMCLLSGSD